MAGRVQTYVITRAPNADYLVQETERILRENNGHKKVRASMNIHILDDELAQEYRRKVLETKKLSLMDLDIPKGNIREGKSFLIHLLRDNPTVKGEVATA